MLVSMRPERGGDWTQESVEEVVVYLSLSAGTGIRGTVVVMGPSDVPKIRAVVWQSAVMRVADCLQGVSRARADAHSCYMLYRLEGG